MAKMALGWKVDSWVTEAGKEKEVRAESAVYVLIYAALLCGAVVDANIRAFVVWYWLLPHILGAGHLRYYQFAEHRACEGGTYTDLDAWGSARTTSTWWIYRQLAWNMPFHIEHHTWPAVPFHLLPKVHERIKSAQPKNRCLISGESGYLAIHREFVRRIVSGEPTSLPPVEPKQKTEDEDKTTNGTAQNRLADPDAISKLPRLTLADVADHCYPQDCWVTVMGVVVDATSFLADHPGGDMVIVSQAGKDATKMFKMIHPEGTLQRHLPDRCIVGVLNDFGNGGLGEPLLNNSLGQP